MTHTDRRSTFRDVQIALQDYEEAIWDVAGASAYRVLARERWRPKVRRARSDVFRAVRALVQKARHE